MSRISPQAIVEPGAQLAADVVVGPFSYIGPRVRLGTGCIIENNVTIVGDTVLGERNHVFPMAVIGIAGASGEDGSVRIGDANAFREHVTVYGGVGEPTRVGNDNLLMIDSSVGVSAIVADHCILANVTHVGPGAILQDYTHTSGFSTVDPGVTVGTYTFIAAYTGIDRDTPPFAMVQGCPFRVRGVNTHKLRKCGFGDDDIRILKDVFRELFNSTGRVDPDALKRLRETRPGNPHIRRLLESIEGAERGA